jgi:hypothetical protein
VRHPRRRRRRARAAGDPRRRARWPAEGGFSDGGLRTLLAEVAEAADVVGVEVTDLPAPALARRVATIVEPLLP